jgi:hypothetical protein
MQEFLLAPQKSQEIGPNGRERAMVKVFLLMAFHHGASRLVYQNMNPETIDFELLFDADEYFRSGDCPWTFFAYPTSLAVERGLPPDDDACELLGLLQRRDIDVAIWVSTLAEDTTYFACRKEDIQRLNDALRELEIAGIIENDFLQKRSERLFANLYQHDGEKGQ